MFVCYRINGKEKDRQDERNEYEVKMEMIKKLLSNKEYEML